MVVSLRKYQELLTTIGRSKWIKSKQNLVDYANKAMLRFNDQFGISKIEEMQMKVIEVGHLQSID